MIMMEKKHFENLSNILVLYPYTFYMFGSRIKSTAKKFSDVDLFFKENIPAKILNELEYKFENSDLPYKVDLVNYWTCDESFKKILDSHYFILPSKTNKISAPIEHYSESK